ncbi:MAG: hypothetical protein C4574_03365 [Candidatus Latescibacterota bacterium]|jgi:hypothetical protein|nr:MAG: hypothetical protein C4574_03365 [Candidatus Latescibacterota bacterium]
MRRLLVVIALVPALALLAGCGRDGVVTPESGANGEHSDVDPRILAGSIIEKSGWPIDSEEEVPVGCPAVTLVGREPLMGDVVHYSYTLRVGSGPYDVIGLHRVVKESRPNHPIRTRKAVFLQHGDGVGFVKFIYGVVAPSAPDDRAFAVYLAKNDVDVWGIDQDWVLVPAGATDFSFMQDWGMQHCIDNLRIGLGVAKTVRLFTGNGPDKLLLLGYSSGASLGFAYVNEEAAMSESSRLVKGYIPVDIFFKTDDAALKAVNCMYWEQIQGMMAAGVYQYDILFAPVGGLARTDPDGASPFVPGFTNLQVALAFGGATFLFDPLLPHWHYVAATFGEDGIPDGLQYMTVDNWLDFTLLASPYEPARFIGEYSAITCEETDLPFDDNLGLVDIPIMYVGAAGGVGAAGLHTTTLLGSTDVTSLIVELYPPDAKVLDFGHIDIFAAENAQALCWTPVLDWIAAHSAHPSDKGNKPVKP